MNRVKSGNIADLALNICMVILVAVSIGWFFTEEGRNAGAGNMSTGGFKFCTFYTNDSAVFAALCSIPVIPFNVKAIRTGRYEIPKWAMMIKFVGTAAVSLTLTVVMVFLGPLMGYSVMFAGVCLFLHLICPLIAIVSFCFFERGMRITGKQAFLGVLPMIVYGTIYTINVIFTGVWEDFYRFNIGGYWYIVYFVFIGFTYLISLGIRFIHNRAEERSL